MKKIIGLAISAFVIIAVVGIGSWAYFNDAEVSNNNVLSAGTLDLKTGDMDGCSENLTMVNMAPGDSVGPATITLKNAGSIEGAHLYFDITYIEHDGTQPTDPKLADNMTADQMAAMIIVDTLTCGTDDLLADVPDGNTSGDIDMHEVTTYFSDDNAHSYTGIIAGATRVFTIEVHMDEDADNDYQADGIEIEFEFRLTQD